MVAGTTERIRVRINGEERELPATTTVAELVTQLGLPRRGIAVEVSGEVVPRSRWSARRLVAGDRVEIVHMVGGG